MHRIFQKSLTQSIQKFISNYDLRTLYENLLKLLTIWRLTTLLKTITLMQLRLLINVHYENH